MTTTKITNSNSCRCGGMICKTCKKEIEGDYLIVNHYISKRGNEDDYAELFCYECSKDRKAWKDYFKSIEKDKINKAKALEHNKKVAIEKIKNSSWIEFTTNDYDEECIVVS